MWPRLIYTVLYHYTNFKYAIRDTRSSMTILIKLKYKTIMLNEAYM